MESSLFSGPVWFTFISVLEIERPDTSIYLQMWQAGLVFGIMSDEKNFLHTGLLLNTGYVSVVEDNSSFPLFKQKNPSVSTSGLVIAPQIFVRMNIAEWFKVRAGIAYNIYIINDQELVSKSDLQNISFDFGFIFSKF